MYSWHFEKGLGPYNSPIMLIPRKDKKDVMRLVTDFRHLNTRLVKLQASIPLMRDAIQILGNSNAECLSLLDIKEAYHTLPLDEESIPICGINPYYGSQTYQYQRLGMGLSVSPAIWQNFITEILKKVPCKKNYLAIMDDMLIHSKFEDHLDRICDLLDAMIEHGLKLSPKKTLLFRTELVFMGQDILIEDGRICIKAMKSKTEAIRKLEPPKTVKACKGFIGMVNFLSMYLKDLQKELIPIYELTKKKNKANYHWGEEQQKAFERIKQLLVSPPV